MSKFNAYDLGQVIWNKGRDGETKLQQIYFNDVPSYVEIPAHLQDYEERMRVAKAELSAGRTISPQTM
jgi:hypothetical protein